MVKLWVSHSELQKEANLGVMKDEGQFYKVYLLSRDGNYPFYVTTK